MKRFARLCESRRTVQRAVCLLAVLVLMSTGCAGGANGNAGNRAAEPVRINDLQEPRRYTTLEDLLPDASAAMATAFSLQPTVGEYDLLNSNATLGTPPGEGEASEEPDRAAEFERDLEQQHAEAERAASEVRRDARQPRRVTLRLMVFRHPDPRVVRATDMLTGTLPEAEQKLWRDNGFIIGELDRQRLPLFMANLPRELSVDVSTLYRVNTYWPLTLIDRLQGPQFVEVADDAGQLENHRLVGGRFQFLIKLVPSIDRDRPRVFLDLLPHHRGVAAELLPRSPTERVLDGTPFDHLRLYHPLSTDRVYVIAGDLPLEEPEDDDEAEGNGEDQRVNTEPVKLGHAMMQGENRRQQVQLLLLIVAD